MRFSATTNKCLFLLLRSIPCTLFLSRFLLLLLLLLLLPFASGTGKGPVGIYAINDEYVVVTDSNFDTLSVVDVARNSGIVATLRLHPTEYDPTDDPTIGEGGDRHMKVTKHWVDPTGVSSCDVCRYIYITSQKDPKVAMIRLSRPLLEMAREHNFEEISRLSSEDLRPIWPQMQSDIGFLLNQSGYSDRMANFKPSLFRMLEIHRNGHIGYLSHYELGIFTFSLNKNSDGLYQNVTHFVPMDQLGATSISGLTLTPDEEQLIITSKSDVHVADVRDRGNGPALADTRINLRELCGIQFKNEEWLQMNFRDAVVTSDLQTLYAIGKPYGSSGTTEVGYGAVLFRIELHDMLRSTDGKVDFSSLTSDHCTPVASKLGNGRGWKDGKGKEVRFTRPHAMLRFPFAENETFILTDIDNRAIRRIRLMPPDDIEEGINLIPRVSTVPYDEDTWFQMYDTSFPFASKNVTVITIEGGRNLSHNDAASACAASNKESVVLRRLCKAEEIRRNLPAVSSINISLSVPSRVWTQSRCHGCWLHFPGFCRHGEGWDEETYMLVEIAMNKEGTRIKEEVCQDQEDTLDLVGTEIILCCDEGSSNNEGADQFPIRNID